MVWKPCSEQRNIPVTLEAVAAAQVQQSASSPSRWPASGSASRSAWTPWRLDSRPYSWGEVGKGDACGLSFARALSTGSDALHTELP